jgi:EAL domain-containing protein (putative c-di-GMP-specific phosphodiesterase class I)/CheY-like chemotaxis protein
MTDHLEPRPGPVRLAAAPTALIVDDDPDVRLVVSAMLRACGVACVFEAAHGREAVGILAERHIAITICDLDMPIMDGVQFMQALGKLSPRMPLLLMSGTNHKVLRLVASLAKGYGLNLIGALRKPLTFPDVRRALGQIGAQLIDTEAPAPNIDATDIRRGLAAGEFLPFYQPVVRVADGMLRSVEALARWSHPRFGIIGPGEFIHAAEQGDQIDTLTLKIAAQAIHQVGAWSEQAWARSLNVPLTLALNLSAAAPASPDFADMMAATADSHRVDPSRVTFELTENQIDDSAGIAQLLSRLRLKGFGLAIDDFGTGHSGLDRLRRLPFTELKIDRSFVSGATGDQEARAILEAGIGLARSLGLASIAEGVEHKEEWQLLASMGCDAAQGFWISPPMPGEKLQSWAEGWSLH